MRKGRKMPIYTVKNETLDEEIGEIYWRGSWRQYVFSADDGVDMSAGCMEEVFIFIKDRMREWLNKPIKRK